MEPIVIGGLIILIFAVWDSYQNWKILHPKKDESPAVGRCEALKNNNICKNTITERITTS